MLYKSLLRQKQPLKINFWHPKSCSLHWKLNDFKYYEPFNGKNYFKTIKTTRKFHGNPGGVDENALVKTVSTRNIIKEMLNKVLFNLDKKLKIYLFSSICLLISGKLINLQVPYFLKATIETLSVDLSTNQILLTTSAGLIVAYGLARITYSLFNELRNAIFSKVAHNSIRKTAMDAFLHLHSLDLNFHLTKKSGMLSKVIDRGTRAMNFFLTAIVFNIFPTLIEITLVAAILGYNFGPSFTFLTIGFVSIYSLVTILITRWRTKYRILLNKYDNEAGSKAMDSLFNYETVKLFNNEQFEASEYNKLLEKYEDVSLKTTTSLSLLNFCQSSIFSIGLLASMLLASQSVINGSMSVGDLIFINSLLIQLSIPLNFLGSTYRDIRQSIIDMQNVFDLQNFKTNIKDDVNAVPLIWNPTKQQNEQLITFDNVTFAYQPNKTILRNLNLSIPYGKKTALVGSSGCGKSTIGKLIYRFYDPDDGIIAINGQNIKHCFLHSLRSNIGIVPQDQILFHNSITYNIKYGDVKATDEQMIMASQLAGLHDSIIGFPNGYDTQVGERGLKLSGGEKQRVAIARVLLKNPKIYIFDEATSSLDIITENMIMSSFKNIMVGKTSIFIAHRLSTIVDSDLIYVMDNGRVYESGTHDKLISNKNSLYSHIWNQQLKPIEPESNSHSSISTSPNADDELFNDESCSKTGCCSK